jgi:hypothetical protein
MMVRTDKMTARPPTIPTMLKVAPTAALFLKKPEEAPPTPVGVALMVRVEPVEVGPEPDIPFVEEIGLLRNVGLWALLDVAPADELIDCQTLYESTVKRQLTYLVTPRVEDAWLLEVEDAVGEAVDDGEAEGDAEEAALEAGEADVAGGCEEEEEFSGVGEDCAEGEGEEAGAGLDAWVFAGAGEEAAGCEGVGFAWDEPEAGAGVVALAW